VFAGSYDICVSGQRLTANFICKGNQENFEESSTALVHGFIYSKIQINFMFSFL
jgi:hypothetical protein